MATGGGEFGYDDKGLDSKIDNDDDLIDFHSDEEVDTTRPFRPYEASTPYHRGEEIQMQTTQYEQSGLPDTSYSETPLLRRAGSITDLQNESLLRQKLKKAVDMIKAKFPKADFETKIKVRRGRGKNAGKIVAIGPKGGEYKILKDDESDLTKSFLDSFKNRLGPRAEEVIVQDRDTAQEQRQRVAEAEEQERQGNVLAAEREKEKQEIEVLRQKFEQIQARIDAHQEEHGSNIESGAELNRLKQLRKNYQKDLDSAKKRLASNEKEAKKNKARVDRERAKIDEMERKTDAMEERLNTMKPLEDVKEQEVELKSQNEED